MKPLSICLLSGVLLPAVLSACAYESRAFNAEQVVLANTAGDEVKHSINVGDTFKPTPQGFQSSSVLLKREPIRTAYYALQLSDAYKRLGDEAARNRDLTAAALITVAGGAALGNAASISGKDLALVLAGGALINEGVKYVNPNSAAQAFYIASESMVCASTAIAAHVPEEMEANFKVTSLAIWYIRKIEVLLRAALERKVPDLKTLLENMDLMAKAAGVDQVSRTVNLAALEAALAKCLRQPPKKE